jgi:superfamily II DNA or RNA helicase
VARLNKASGILEVVRGCSSWQDVQARLHPLLEKEKGDLFEELVKAYLLLEPEYATKLKKVWLYREVPQTIALLLKLPPVDQGIDLIAQTKGGQFWAIQCKYRDQTNRSLTWREVSTFAGLAFGVCRGISFGLLCSTTERITHVLKDQDRIAFCALDVWQGLGARFLARLRGHLAKKPVALEPTKPRPHQKQAITDARRHFVGRKARRGKLIMPCGTGKSLTAYWIAKELGARRAVVAVPSLALIRQTLKVWLRETIANRQAVEWICVCSDETAGRIDRDDVSVLRQDLGVPCLTDPTEIAAWLKRKHRGLTVVFTTYQSGEALSRAARSARFGFDLGVMDEAHKTVGDGAKLFSHLLHDRNLPISRRIFMTATERRYAGESEAVLSMDNPAIYGETFHLLSFKRALEYAPPILSDYKIMSIAVSRAEVAELIRKNVFVRPDKGRWDTEIEAEMLASLIALRKAMAKHPIRHAVSFHSSIQRAELFKVHNDAFGRAFPRHGGPETFHVSGKTATGTRARIVGEFERTRRGLITNARCLTEGVDVPGIDCVLFADPRRSAVDIVQAVGRALRPAPGKKLGYVIVPVLHEANATPDDILESDSFREVLTMLRALAANDDRIVEYFRAVSQGRQRTGGGTVEFDLDERVAKRIDLEAFVREIDLRCWDRLARLSWRRFKEARAFARGLGLKSFQEWRAYSKGQTPQLGRLPADIPAAPHQTYANEGWQGYGDWLGTGNVATFLREYRPFRQARAAARRFNLKGSAEWFALTKGKMPKVGCLPSDVPAAPNQAYAGKGWKSWGDWLGTGRVAYHLKEYQAFPTARAFARNLKLKNNAEWREYCDGRMPELGHLPTDIPRAPDQKYADAGWKNWGDWLGTGTIAYHLRRYRSFRSARAFARNLRLAGSAGWSAFCRGEMPGLGCLPADVPKAPDQKCARAGWKNWGDWLGTGVLAPWLREYRPFAAARKFARRLRLRNNAEWRAYCNAKMPKLGRLPPDIPKAPEQKYAGEGWKSWGDWLGTGYVAQRLRQYRPFQRARAFVHTLKLKSGVEWRAFCAGRIRKIRKLSDDIPANPNSVYAGQGWKGMGDWLGTGTVAPQLRVFRAFSKARAFARRLSLESRSQWRRFCNGEMPALGNRPADIPTNPDTIYSGKGWKDYGDWLENGSHRDSGGTRNEKRHGTDSASVAARRGRATGAGAG